MKKNKEQTHIKSVLFYGNFGVPGEAVYDGQRTKARNVTEEVQKRYKKLSFSFFNTNNYKKHPVLNFFKLLSAVRKVDSVFIYPGSSHSLSIILFAMWLSNKCKKSFYPVVGGFLGEYCKKHKFFCNRLKQFAGIFCETNGLMKKMVDMNFSNVYLSPVFTKKQQEPFSSLEKLFPNDNAIKFCTFGRVCKEKGIKNAIETIALVRKKTGKDIYLDIYGKTFKKDNFEEEFYELLNRYKDFVTYKGPLPDNSFDILSSYHYMLFATYFYGEGFPACVLESYLFATPVIASNWRYNSEFVSDNTGYLFELNDNSFEKTLIKAIDDIKLNYEKKKKAYEYAKQFSPDYCLKPIFVILDKYTEE